MDPTVFAVGSGNLEIGRLLLVDSAPPSPAREGLHWPLLWVRGQ